MLDRALNSGVFAGIAAAFGFGFSFLILKAMKVETPHEHKAFYPLLAVGMLIAYILRAGFRVLA